MRAIFVYVGFLLIVIGIISGVIWLNGPSSQDLVAQGTATPDGNGLPFELTAPGSSSSVTITYQYGSGNAQVEVQACPSSEQGPGCTIGQTQVLANETGASKTFTINNLPTGKWYLINATQPVLVTATVPPTAGAVAEEGLAGGGLVGGLVLLIVGLWLKDPLNRPTPRLAQTKRTLYFFFQSWLAVLGLAIIIFFISVAILSPVLAPVSPANGIQANGAAGDLPLYCAYEPVETGSGTWSYSPPGGCESPQCVYPNTDVAPNIPPGDCLPVSAIGAGGTDVLTGQVGPTWTVLPWNQGVLPFGALTLGGASIGSYVNIYQGVIRAAPWDLTIAGAIVGSGALIGLMLGALAGYVGGYTDEVVMRLTDIFLSIPGLFLILVVLAVFGPSLSQQTNTRLLVLIGAFVITWWPSYTRIVRGQVLVTREQKYVEAAKASGAGSGRILRKHVIPNSIFPVMVSVSLDIGAIPLALAVIAFLGFTTLIFPAVAGLFPEWGILAASSVNTTTFYSWFLTAGYPIPWWQILFPGLTLFLFCIAVNFLSDGLRDALDPRLRR